MWARGSIAVCVRTVRNKLHTRVTLSEFVKADGALAASSVASARRLGRRRRFELGVAVQKGVSKRARRRRVDDRRQEWNTPTRTVDGILACWEYDVPARAAAALSDAEADQRQALNERVAPDVNIDIGKLPQRVARVVRRDRDVEGVGPCERSRHERIARENGRDAREPNGSAQGARVRHDRSGQASTWRVGWSTDARLRQRSVERKTGRPIEGREKPFGVSQNEERENLRMRAASERVLQRSHADADDFRPAGLWIPGFAQEVHERVNPFVLGRVEAHRVNATPMTLIARTWRHSRRTLRHRTHKPDLVHGAARD